MPRYKNDTPDFLTGLTGAQVLAEIEYAIQSMPTSEQLLQGSEEASRWLGHATAAMSNWGDISGVSGWQIAVMGLEHSSPSTRAPSKMLRLLHQAQNDLRMKTVGPVNVAIGKGLVFSYMDTLSKIIRLAKSDILFVDRYIDGSFASDYLPHVSSGVPVRILTRRDKQTERHLSTLIPLCEKFHEQYSHAIEIRSSTHHHDRLIIVDHTSGYASSASFKDGPRTAGATITQHEPSIFETVRSEAEQNWAKAEVELFKPITASGR